MSHPDLVLSGPHWSLRFVFTSDYFPPQNPNLIPNYQYKALEEDEQLEELDALARRRWIKCIAA